MAILFAVVARGTTILAKHAWCGGNFLEVTEQILAKIPSENNKLTYSHGRYGPVCSFISIIVIILPTIRASFWERVTDGVSILFSVTSFITSAMTESYTCASLMM